VADEPDTLEQLVSLLAGLFTPLRAHIEDGTTLQLVAELGIEFPDSLASDPAFTNALTTIASGATNLPALVDSLIAAVDSDDHGAALQIAIDLIKIVRDLIVSAAAVATAIDAKKATFPGLTPTEVEAFAADFPKRLVDYLIIRQVEDAMAPASATLDFIGVFERTEQNVGSTNPLKPPFIKRDLNLRGITDFITSPGAVLEAKYGWGAPGFDGRALLHKLETLANELGLPAVYTDTPTPTLDVMFLEVQPKTDVSPPGLRLRVHSMLKGGDTFTVDDPQWSMTFGSEVVVPVDAVLVVQPNGSFELTPPAASGQVQGTVSASFTTKPDPGTNAFILVGEAGKSRLEFQQFSMGASATLAWTAATSSASGDFTVGAEVKGGQLVVDLSNADGFIGEIMSGVNFAAQFDFAMGVTRDGFYFRGSSALEIQLPIHIDLAIVELQSLTVGIGLKPEGIPISLGADIKANLGPLVAVVENMGLTATFAFADDRKGDLGPLDLVFSFKPPNGVGLSIDAAVVKGGGYLFFDFDKEEYAGALELAVAEIVTVKAIGLVTTRLPDGSKGFSLLIIITAEFAPIQLGFGFTLIGLGGLLGLNRTMMLERLAEGVRTGAVESVMFPTDVIANAPRIISDLKVFFPPENGIFLVGPMAKLGWGTPTLVSLSLGIIVEIPPGNIAILGVLKVVLPHEDAALLVLQVNFIGALEFDKQRVWFFASLFESRVLFITIEGEMGLLVAWGDDANFVVSVGGFHPAFNPPPLPFPNPKRIAISILNESFAKIRVEGYFAVTSNTVQFGARVEIFFGLDEFNIQGHLAFDALFQFSPFYFIITISASFGVKVFGVGLFSVRMRGQLEGTSPWHIEGEGSISILFFDIDVPFSHTWGEEAQTTLPPIDVLPLLQEELDKLENWTASIPASNRLLVSLRKIDVGDDLVLHPLGVLRVSQRALPLDLTLDKVGANKPRDVDHLSVVVAGSDLAKRADAEERFATAQFKALSDSQKLSTPAFERQHSGVELGVAGEPVQSDRAIRRTVRYEVEIIDTNFKRFASRFRGLVAGIFAHFLSGNAASKSSLSAKAQQERAPVDLKVAVAEPVYVVASIRDNTAVSGDAASFTSRAKADDYMRDHVARHPKMAGGVHVIPVTEARNAA
jgi:hypothetical protein